MNQKPLLVLIDGSAVFHRGYHAIPPLSTRDGVPTNAVLGFANIVLKVLNELKPTYAVVAWDKSSQTFRKEMYPEYKATRTRQPDDLYAQIPTTHELVDALNLPWVELENYEADDIIGTFAYQAEQMGDVRVVIATGDKDQLQLVSETTVVDMFNPRGMEPTRYDLAKMHDRYGLTPLQFIDYKALLGDKSDNIPGVAGIGDVGARKLLSEYKTLDGIYDHLDDVTGKVHDYLEKSREIAYLSQDLSRIRLDAPVLLDLEAARIGRYDREHVVELFRRLEFRSLLSKLPPETNAAAGPVDDPTPLDVDAGRPRPSGGDAGPLTLFGGDEAPSSTTGESPVPERAHLKTAKYHAVTTKADLDELVEKLREQPVFAFDTETDSLDTLTVNLVGLSVSFDAGEAYYVPVAHTEGTQLDRDAVIAALKPVLEDPNIGKVGHNLKYDYEVLRRYDVMLAPVVMDTMIAAYLLNSAGRAQSLDDLAYSELGVEMIPISELIGKGKTQVTFDQTLIETATTYAAEDADMSWRLYKVLNERMTGTIFEKLAAQMEWPLIPVLAEMELAGIELDRTKLAEFGGELEKEIAKLKVTIYDLAGEEFNLGSPAQMGQILYGRLGLSTAGLKKGKTGFSTAAGELEKLRLDHPIVDHIMRYREYDKLKNTYVDALPELVKHDGRVHTSFNQAAVATGRLSSTNPNLQNIPVRTELGRKIREAFVAPEGRVLVSADYSQIELRVAAALAQDEAMIQTFRDGIDLHAATASMLYGVPLDEVTKEQRYATKAVNFGVLYGMSAHGLSVATGMMQNEASEFIKRYFEVRPKLRIYIDATKKFAYDNLYTETLFGRRRSCPEIRSTNFQLRQGAERVAVNVPIQGTAADIYKLAMIALDRRLDDDCTLLLQIHDELIVEAPAEKGQAVAALMKATMEQVYDLGVPLAVDTEIATDWGSYDPIRGSLAVDRRTSTWAAAMIAKEMSALDGRLRLLVPDITRDPPLSVGWLNGANGHETMRLMGNPPESLADTDLEVETGRVQQFIDGPDEFNWMIEADGQVIGSVWIQLTGSEYLPGPSVHVMIGEMAARGRGFGQAALATVILWAHLNLDKALVTRALVDNAPSRQLLKKLGARPDGEPYADADGLSWQNYRFGLLSAN